MWECNIRDAGIKHFHKSRQRHHKCNQPGICFWLPGRRRASEGGAHEFLCVRIISRIVMRCNKVTKRVISFLSYLPTADNKLAGDYLIAFRMETTMLRPKTV